MNRRTLVAVALLGSAMQFPARAASELAASELAASELAVADLKVIYVGGLDCQPCTSWKNRYKAGWLASPEYKQVTWIEVEAPRLKDAYQERFWPGDLKPILDQLPRKSGTPRFLIVKDGKVVANDFGVNHWSKIMAELKKQLE